MTLTHALSTNNYGPAKFIVAASAAEGTHTTIAAALTSSSSGDTIFIRPGTYTENITLKAGVDLCTYIQDALTPNVTILGTCTLTTAGTVSISGIQLKTNSAFALAVTGSAASIVNLTNCYINASNNTAISFTSSSASSAINIIKCDGDIGTTGISMFSGSATGNMEIRYSNFTNSGSSTTASTWSGAGILNFRHCLASFPLTYSSASLGGIEFTNFFNSNTNATCVTTSGTGSIIILNSTFGSGTASAISIGVGTTVSILQSGVNSSNANAVTGAGTVNIGSIDFSGTSSTINTTTQNRNIIRPSFSTVSRVFTANDTYTPTSGMVYCVIECQGGGGGGGGTATSSIGFYSSGGGGGGGNYSRKTSTAADIGASQTVTIGSAGTAGTAGNNAGGNGGDTSVGSICIGKGGTGGSGSPGSASANGGAGGVAGTGDFTCPGETGGAGLFSGITAATGFTGPGGSSYFGGGAPMLIAISANVTGPAAPNYGGGGGGGVSHSAGGAVAGGAGTAGIVVIQEYILS